jgi:steroid delta-isomerase-like uncharacterized protein
MSEENKALMRRWFEEVWTNRNADAIDEMFAEDGIAHGLKEGEEMRGPAAFKEYHRRFCGAFPDIAVDVVDILAEGDKVAARCVVRGTHAGDHLGSPATNKPIEISGISIVRIRDGKIVEGWNTFDFMALYRQIGAM